MELDAAEADEYGLKPGPYLMLSLTDTGTGMDSETKTRLFEPFFTTKERGKGTGLGLATVYGIVKQLGGHIRVLSEIDEGTTFIIYLPRDMSGSPAALGRKPIADVPSGTETILLVEDQNDVRTLARDVLIRLGYRVLDVGQPAEAVLLAGRMLESIHLLLTDIALPGMTGTELAERLLESHPGLKVLYMSGYAENVIDGAGGLKNGRSFLQKPFSVGALGRSVRAALDGVE